MAAQRVKEEILSNYTVLLLFTVHENTINTLSGHDGNFRHIEFLPWGHSHILTVILADISVMAPAEHPCKYAWSLNVLKSLGKILKNCLMNNLIRYKKLRLSMKFSNKYSMKY